MGKECSTLKSYAGENKERYIEYLKEKKKCKESINWSNNLYQDPDLLYDIKYNDDYYKQITKFLNEQEKKYKNSFKYELVNGIAIQSDTCKGYKEPPSIKAIDINTKTILFLRTDQFGFRAPQGKLFDVAWNNKYPYAAYIEKNGSEEFAANVLWMTRSLGGAFLWPLFCSQNCVATCSSDCENEVIYNKYIKWYNPINAARGVKSYIEDRVDLTLLEIKHALDGNYSKKENVTDILYKKYTVEKSPLRTWFEHFESFDQYVEYFKFDDFVENGTPINIITGKKLVEKEMDSKKMKRVIEKLEKNELERMLNNLGNMTQSRTEKIMDVISKCQ